MSFRVPSVRRVVPPALSLSTLAIVVTLAGCAYERYEPAPLDARRVPAARAAARLDDAAHGALVARHAPQAPWPPREWSCRELGLVAAARSGALARARAELAAREAERAVAGQRPNPRVSVGVSYNSDQDPGDDNHYGIGPGFDYLWSPVDRRRIRVGQADARIVAARSALLEAAWAARDRACRAATALAAARDADRAREAQVALLDEAVALAETRARAGLADAFEWQSLRLEANGARLDRLDRLARVTISGAELAAALALAPAALGDEHLAARTDPGAWPSAPAIQTHALSHHPRMLTALAAYDEAERDLELAIAAQYPDIELSPGYFFDQGDHLWSLVGGIVVPLFATQKAAIAAAAARRDAARAAVEQVQGELVAGVEQAYAAWQAQRTLRAALAQTAAAVEDSIEAIARQQADGLGDGLMLKRAELQRAQVALRAVEVEAGYRRALLALERAAALPFDGGSFADYLHALYHEGARMAEEVR